MGKEFSSMIKSKRFRKKKTLSHSPLLPSNFWMLCVRTHMIMKRGGHLDSWGRAWRPSWLMRESMEAILTCEGEAKGTADSLNLCPAISEMWVSVGSLAFTADFSYLPFYPPPFLSSHLLYPYSSLLTLFTYLMLLKLGWSESRTQDTQDTRTQEKLQVLNCPR